MRNDKRTPTVLVADALPAARAYVTGILRAEGRATVAECGEASQIVAVVRQREADVVFLDVGIPGLDPEACVRNLQRGADTRSAVVVLTCPRDIDQSRLAGLEATSGALLVLVKPLTPAGVLSAFQQALDESGARKSKPGARSRRAA